MPLASTAADRTSGINDGTAHRGRDRASISRSAGSSVVELALYTVEGRQAGDLPQRCGIALIRKAKLPARLGGRSSLLAGVPFGRDG